jgi:tetratricopeptide (TPR) repeat protein
MKKNLPVVMLLILHICTTLSGQSWREVDFHTKEGYQTLLDQYDHDDDLSSINERFAFYKTCVQAARHHRDSAWLSQFAYRVASTANALDSLDTALEYIAIARSAIDEEDDFIINVINYQGVLHKQSGDYEQGLAYYEEALQLAREKFPDKAVMPLSNIATLYRSQKEYSKTLEYLYQLDEIAQELESPHREYRRVYNNAEFCIVHKALNNLDSAAYYAQLCIQNLDKLDKRLNMKTAGFAYITVAEFYIEKLQQPERAKPLLDSALLYVEGLYLDKVKVSLGKYYLAKRAYADAGAVVRELQETDIQAHDHQITGIGAGRAVLYRNRRLQISTGNRKIDTESGC